jgi:hypothetical protein
MRRWAKVTHRFAGTHSWPNVPADHPHAYLKHEHRHLFHVTLTIEVFHNDRDIEYLEARDWLVKVCDAYTVAGSRSCEQMAQEIIMAARERWPTVSAHRAIKVEVLEDGENGALLEG